MNLELTDKGGAIYFNEVYDVEHNRSAINPISFENTHENDRGSVKTETSKADASSTYDHNHIIEFQYNLVADLPKLSRIASIVSNIVATSFFTFEFDSIPRCCGVKGFYAVTFLCRTQLGISAYHLAMLLANHIFPSTKNKTYSDSWREVLWFLMQAKNARQLILCHWAFSVVTSVVSVYIMTYAMIYHMISVNGGASTIVGCVLGACALYKQGNRVDGWCDALAFSILFALVGCLLITKFGMAVFLVIGETSSADLAFNQKHKYWTYPPTDCALSYNATSVMTPIVGGTVHEFCNVLNNTTTPSYCCEWRFL